MIKAVKLSSAILLLLKEYRQYVEQMVQARRTRKAAKKIFFSGQATERGPGLKNNFFDALKGLSGWATKKNTFFAASLRLLASPVLQNNYPSI